MEWFGVHRLSSLLEMSFERQFFELSMDYAAINHRFGQLFVLELGRRWLMRWYSWNDFVEHEGIYSENTAVLETRLEPIQNLINDV
jgi:hypothetical protein